MLSIQLLINHLLILMLFQMLMTYFLFLELQKKDSPPKKASFPYN